MHKKNIHLQKIINKTTTQSKIACHLVKSVESAHLSTLPLSKEAIKRCDRGVASATFSAG